ncbi:MAG: prepilin-type N-terminal cleavage/methylation domain-containing protein [Opitutus sp.]|nr:prepilin-type N-terminal cleavage/methylation domain-containing protein [Opitutus sp.]
MRPISEERGGFTLIELLVVIAIIAGVTAVLIGGLRSNKAAALQNGQATVANLLTAARTKAAASGCRVRVLIHADPSNPARFRRMLVVQQESAYKADDWTLTLSVVSLPEGIVVLPHSSRVPTGFYESSNGWRKSYGSEVLSSSSLHQSAITAAVQSSSDETWDRIQFTPNDTMTFGSGDVVLARAVTRQPGSYAAGESPVRAESPDSVRGVSISTYGVAALINTRSGF